MSAKHTPGPWTHIGPRAYTSDTQLMATAGYRRDTAEEVANIRLIAAAPDLLAVCQAILRYQALIDSDQISGLIDAYAEAFEAAEVAVAKATGAA